MSGDRREQFFDLLIKKAVYSLDEAEQRELDRLDPGSAEDELLSLEMTAAALSMIDSAADEPLPASLASKIEADSAKWVGDFAWPPKYNETETRKVTGWFGLLGWGVAVAACTLLVFNFYLTDVKVSPEAAMIASPVPSPRTLSNAELRDELVRNVAVIRANWAPGNVKELRDVSGDVVWSDEKQVGYMRFRGLPVNDPTKEAYQLWIYDKTQDKTTPIDGGVFDVQSDGEVVIPIDAKLKAVEPGMFLLTIEKPGGVVVSKRERIAALATVETD